MSQISVISKLTGVETTMEGSQVTLSHSSIVELHVERADIANYARNGNDLVISLHSGEVITLKNFYVADAQGVSQLVLSESDGALWWIEDPTGAATYESIASTDVLLAASGSETGGAAVWPWVLGGLAAAGGVAIAASSGGGGGGDDDHNSNPGNPGNPGNPNNPDTTPPDAPTGLQISGDGKTVTGRAEPGSTITLKDSEGNLIGTGKTNSDGTFTIELGTPLTNGQQIVATATDPSGNVSQEAHATAPDTTAPDAPEIVLVNDNVGSDAGPVGNGKPTNDATPTLSGIGEAGATITVYDNGKAIGTTKVDAEGKWSFTPATALAEGSHTLTATATDAAGNTSPASTNVSFIVDTLAPQAPVITGVTDDVSPNTGAVGNGGSTNDQRPTLTGTAEANSTVTIYDKGIAIGTVKADGSGKWTFTPDITLGEGSHQFTVKATDAAGNTGAASGAYTVIVDSVAPTVPVLSSVTDDAGTIKGPLTSGQVTDDARPTFNGTGEAGTIISVYDKGVYLGQTTVSSNGTWAFTPSADLAEGSHQITVRSTDAAGNTTAAGGSFTFTVDVTPPATPVAVIVNDTSGSIVGAVENGGLTDETRPRLSGTGTAGDTITIYDNGQPIATVPVSANGTWSYTPTGALAEGPHAITVRETDPAGNQSQPSQPINFVVDTTPPEPPQVEPMADTGIFVTGVAEAGSTVFIYDGTTLIGQGIAGTDGRYSVRVTPAQTDGKTLTAVAEDAAGNLGNATTFTASNSGFPDTPVIIRVDNDNGDDPVSVGFGQATNDNTPLISGTSAPNATITLYDNGILLGTAQANGSGEWSFPSPILLDNTHVITATATTPAGTSGDSISFTVIIDTVPPVAPDDVDVVANGTQVTGSAEAGSTITVKDANGVTIGTGVAGNDGSFTVSISPAQKNGETLNVTATDKAGNGSLATPVEAPDSTAPNSPTGVVVAPDGGSISGSAEPGSTVTIKDPDGTTVGEGPVGQDGTFTIPLSPAQNNGEVLDVTATDGTGNISTPAQTTAPDTTAPDAPSGLTVSPDGTTLTGTAEPGTTVTVKQGTATIGTGPVDDAGNFTVTLNPPQKNGETLDVSAKDPTGNIGDSTPVNAPDVTPPAVPVIVSVEDNVEANTGLLDNGVTTNDNTPLLRGTGEAGSTLSIFDNGRLVDTVQVDGTGNWSFTPPALAEGGHIFTVSAADTAGNSSGLSNSWSITVDTQLPAAPVVSSVVDDVEGVTGALTSGQQTNDNRPTLNGSGEPGATITILLDGNPLGTAVVGRNGAWVFTPPADIPDGNYVLTTVATDAAGNQSPASPGFNLNIFTDAPSVPVIESITDDVGPVTGGLTDGAVTDDSSPLLQGTTDPGTTITVFDGANPIGTATVNGTGQWTFTPSSPLPDGTHSLTVVATNSAGTTTTSDPIVIRVDTLAPDTPDAPAVTVNPDGSEVTLGSGDITRDTNPVLSGTGTEGDTITIYNGNEALGTVVIPPGGVWTWTPPGGLDDGTYNLTLTVTAKDGAGNESAPSQPVSITIDTEAPDAPTPPSVVDNVNEVTGPVTAGDSINDPRPVLSGTGTPNDVITIFDSVNGGATQQIGVVTVGADGNWTWRPDTPLGNAQHAITTTATDEAGNVSVPSSDITFTVDTTPPVTPVITDVAGVATGGATDDATPTLSGTGTTGDQVIIYNNGVEIARVFVDAGVWTYTPDTALPNGTLNLTASSIDAAGNVSGTSPVYSVTIDTVAPTTPLVDSVSDSNLVGGVHYTQDTAPTLSGTGEPGATITVSIDNTPSTITAVVQPDGTWTWSPDPALADNTSHTLVVTSTDAAGNLSGSTTITLNVDNLPPSAPADLALTEQGTPLTGTGEAGSTITVRDGTTVIGTGVVGQDGTFSIALTPAQTNPTTLEVTAIDLAGNVSAETPFTVVDVPDLPAIPVIATLIDNEGPVTGDVKGRSSDDTTPTLNGTAVAGSTVTLYLDGVLLDTVVADATTGAWSYTPTTELTEGLHRFEVTATVDGQTSGLSPAATVTIDTTAPAAPTIGAVTDDVGPGTGPLTTGQATNDDRPTLSGTATPGDTLSVYDNGNLLGTVVVGATGAWSFTPPSALSNDTHSLTVRATDPAGNQGPESAPFVVIVDTVSTTPVITGAEDNVGTVVNVPSGGTTNDATPLLSGTAEANSTIAIFEGGTQIGTVLANASGAWSFTPTSPLTDGTHTFNVTATDPLGNVSSSSNQYTVIVDTVVPDTPVLTAVTDNVPGGVNGALTSGQVTNDSTPTLTGTGNNGETIHILDNGTEIATVQVGSDGTWTWTSDTALPEGPHSIRINASDAAGNVSANTPAFVLTVDTAPPVAPTLTSVLDDIGPGTGALVTGSTTNDTQPTLNGTGEIGSTIHIFDNNVEIGTAVVNASGTWTFTPTTPLGEGPHVLGLTATDPAGNTSTGTTLFNLTVDTLVPNAPVLNTVTDDQLPSTGTLTNGQATNDPQPTLAGTAEVNAVIRIYDNGVEIAQTRADETGNWTFSPTLANGSHTLTLTATDAAGNVSQPSTGFTVVVDTVAPVAPIISQGVDDVGTLTGTFGSGQVTDDTLPVLNGTSEANAVVRLFENGIQIGQTTAGADGSWTIQLTTALTTGPHTITATATDAAGNVSTPSGDFVINIDNTPPAVPVVTSVVDDVGATVNLTNGQVTNDALPTLNGTAEAGATVNIYDGTTLLGSVVATGGNWSFTPTTALGDGSHTLTVTATDAAGNVSAPTTGFVIVVDASAPAAPVISSIVDDVGTVTGAITGGNPTNDTRPTLNGTAEANATVRIYDGTTLVGTVTADANGNWTLPQTSTTLTEGQHNFTATATDAAGNTSAASPVTSITVDVTPPALPVGLAVITNGTHVTGTAEAGSTVTITTSTGTVLGTATADGSGNFNVTIAPAQTGGETLLAFATDKAGNAGANASVTAPFTTLPNAPVIATINDNVGTVTGNLTNGKTTDDTTPTLSGTAQPNATVTLYNNGVAMGTVVADGAGNWTFTTPALSEGSHAFTASASNATGTGPISGATTVIVDVTAPTQPTGTFNTDGSVLTGNAEAGSTVTIRLADNSTVTTTADSNGNFTYTFLNKQTEGQTLQITATDAAGNVSPIGSALAPVVPLSASTNVEELELSTTATVTNAQYNDYGFLLVGALGNALTLLGNDTAQVGFTVGNGGSADISVNANATGAVLSLLNTLELVVQRFDSVNNTWTTVVDTGQPQFADLLTLGATGVSLNLAGLANGQYRVLSYNTNLLATGSYTSIDVAVKETSAGTVTGETSLGGNVILDTDPTAGSDNAPAGTTVSAVTNSQGDTVNVTANGTVIQGLYGTLTINLDGTYTYNLTNTSASVIGRTENFTYTITHNGASASANLVLSLGAGTTANSIVAVDNTASLTYDTTVHEINNGTSSQGGFTVVGVNLGNTLGLNLLDDLSNPIIYSVEEGTTRTMTIQASVGGVALASVFDLYIYKFNDATQTFEQMRVQPGWLRAPLLGGTSSQLTLNLPSGEYLFLLNTAAGITALTGYTLNVLEDHVYSVSSVGTSTTGNVLADDIAPSGTVVSDVNGVAVNNSGVTSIVGEYGTLTINASGQYTYTLKTGVGADHIDTPDTFVYTITAPGGAKDTASLNITPTARAMDAVNDVSQVLDVTSVHHTSAYSDTTVGTASWNAALLAPTSGSGSGTFVVDANTALHNVVLHFNVASLLTLGGLTVNWTISQGGTTLRTGSFGGGLLLGGNADIAVTGLDLNAGTYTLSYTGSMPALGLGGVTITPSVTGTTYSLSQFDATSGHTVNGNIFDGTDSAGAMDQLHSVDTRLSVTGYNGVTTTLDPYTGSATVNVVGHYGTLAIAADGHYTYTLNAGVSLSTITSKEVFNYTLTDAAGKTDSATLTINMAPQFISSEHNDVITGTAYGDTLIYQVLNNTVGNATAGNVNSTAGDHWTNFSLAQGDKIDIGDLLVGWNGSASTLGNYLHVTNSNGNTVISIDRDGAGGTYTNTTLVTLDNVQTTYDELVNQQHIIT